MFLDGYAFFVNLIIFQGMGLMCFVKACGRPCGWTAEEKHKGSFTDDDHEEDREGLQKSSSLMDRM